MNLDLDVLWRSQSGIVQLREPLIYVIFKHEYQMPLPSAGPFTTMAINKIGGFILSTFAYVPKI